MDVIGDAAAESTRQASRMPSSPTGRRMMGWFGRQFLRAVVALSLGLGGTAAWALKCDVDNNGRIDRADISLIQQAVVARAPVSGPDDPRDADNNGVINSIDSRLCVLRCKYPSCATNGAPLADAGPDQTVRVTERVQLNGAASADPDGNALVYSWSFVSRPAGSAAVLSNPGAVNPSFVADRPGNYDVQLVVGDGSLSSAPDRVTISTVNSVPVANAGPDQSARVGDLAVLDGRASSDVDGDAITYAWRIVSAPGGSTAALIDATTVQPRITLDAAGTYVFELIVSDAGSTSAPDTVVVSTVNTAPVARPGANRAVALGALVPLDGSASSDVDGNALTYTWALLSRPAGSAAVLSNAGVVNPSFSADLPGSYVAQLIVNDGFVDSAPASVTITTENAAPRANAGADQTVPLGAPVQLDGSASSDPEGAALTYAWSITSRPAGSSATLNAGQHRQPGLHRRPAGHLRAAAHRQRRRARQRPRLGGHLHRQFAPAGRCRGGAERRHRRHRATRRQRLARCRRRCAHLRLVTDHAARGQHGSAERPRRGQPDLRGRPARHLRRAAHRQRRHPGQRAGDGDGHRHHPQPATRGGGRGNAGHGQRRADRQPQQRRLERPRRHAADLHLEPGAAPGRQRGHRQQRQRGRAPASCPTWPAATPCC
jgi:hypothetical protein